MEKNIFELIEQHDNGRIEMDLRDFICTIMDMDISKRIGYSIDFTFSGRALTNNGTTSIGPGKQIRFDIDCTEIDMEDKKTIGHLHQYFMGEWAKEFDHPGDIDGIDISIDIRIFKDEHQISRIFGRHDVTIGFEIFDTMLKF